MSRLLAQINIPLLKAFIYHTGDIAFFKRRTQWFLPIDQKRMTLWYVENESNPDVKKVDPLYKYGSSGCAFDYRSIGQF